MPKRPPLSWPVPAVSLRRGAGRRLTGLFALSLLMLNLLAGILLPPRAIDLAQVADLLSLCSTPGMAMAGNSGAQPGDASEKPSQGGVQCIFCLPLLHAGPQPENAAFLVLPVKTGHTIVHGGETSPLVQALPPGRAAPRAPPSYS